MLFAPSTTKIHLRKLKWLEFSFVLTYYKAKESGNNIFFPIILGLRQTCKDFRDTSVSTALYIVNGHKCFRSSLYCLVVKIEISISNPSHFKMHRHVFAVHSLLYRYERGTNLDRIIKYYI